MFKPKKKKNNCFNIFNKKTFIYYYNVLRKNPEKTTIKFLSGLILKNSKIEKHNIKFFSRHKDHLNDAEDDEEFFVRVLMIFIISFFF